MPQRRAREPRGSLPDGPDGGNDGAARRTTPRAARRRLGVRPMRSATLSCGVRRPSSTWYTFSVTGMSMPSRPARSWRAYAVGMPSTTWPTSASTSAGEAPLASSSPASRLRLCREVHVAMRSPRPARPMNVPMCAPWITPSRVISATLRVIRLARELSPKPRPSDMPTATAMGFLAAPQNSTPTTSSLLYTRNVSLVTAACRARAMLSSAAAITVADGMSRLTSSAWLGPERARPRRTRLLGDHLRRPLERAQLVALGQGQLQRARGAPAEAPARHLAHRLRRHGVHDELGAGDVRVVHGREPQLRGQHDAGKEVRVLVRRVELHGFGAVSVSTCTPWPRCTSRRENALPQLPEPMTVTSMVRPSPPGTGAAVAVPRAAAHGARCRRAAV